MREPTDGEALPPHAIEDGEASYAEFEHMPRDHPRRELGDPNRRPDRGPRDG